MSDRAERATRAGLKLRYSRMNTRDLEVQVSTNLCSSHDGLAGLTNPGRGLAISSCSTAAGQLAASGLPCLAPW